MKDALDLVIPDELNNLSILVEKSPERLASGSEDLRLAALQAAKYVFDMALQSEAQSIRHITDLLASLSPSQAPQTRSQAKRKRSPEPAPALSLPMLQSTPLSALYVDGMDDDQVWAQLELRTKNVCDTLEFALEATGEDVGDDDSDDESAAKRPRLGDEGEDEDADMDMDALEEMEDAEMFGSDDEDDDDEGEDDDDDEDHSSDDADLGEGVTELRDPSSDEDEDAGPSTLFTKIQSAMNRADKPKKRGAHPELDDDFFSLADFNAETERAEARKVSRGSLGKSLEDDEEDSEDGDVEDIDLFKPVDDDEAPDTGETDGEEPMYRDFFDPPPRIPSGKGKAPAAPAKKAGQVRFHDEVRVKNIKSRGKGVPVSTMSLLGPKAQTLAENEDDEDEYGEIDFGAGEDEGSESGDDNEDGGGEEDDDDDEMYSDLEFEEDGQETIERFRDDLFGEEEEDDSETDLTAHERRQADLRAQIEELEAENVAKKDWTLMGEATARSRPQNSLLEEDLDFERVMKAVPVVTEELVQRLEDRIKARILEGRFDDVVRQRPVDDKPFLPSRFFELQDTKSKQSLAEIYEDEYVAAQTGGVTGEDRDGKLKQEHEEVEKLWEGICYKLDALCNAHFTPKQTKALITTVSNVAAATLESALPTSSSTRTMLAPEEVFAPGSADPRTRSELAPIEKRALRNKQKKAKRKARDQLDRSVDKFARKVKGMRDVKRQKEEALKSVVKTGRGVTIVGKKNKEVLGKKGQTK